jgi:hypothetical protein
MSRVARYGAVMLALTIGASVSAADWPQWRGPHGTGVSDERDLPVRWSATENVAWQADLGGVGVSSPIVAGDRVFVTSQIGAGIVVPARGSPRARARRRQVNDLLTSLGQRAMGRTSS